MSTKPDTDTGQPAAETLEEITEKIIEQIPSSDRDKVTRLILSALRNERERCAKVAEEHKFSSEAHRTHSNLCTDAIAASIREGIET